MSNLKVYKFSDLYEMSSGISSKPEQAGHGNSFISFKNVFNNYFLPEELCDKMNTSEREQEIYSVQKGDIFLTRTSETLDELGMSSVAYKDYPQTTFSGFLKRLRPKQNDITYHRFMAFYLRSGLFRSTMNNNAIMTLRASLNEQIFSYLDLILPSYNNQKKIGDLFFDIHKKIELNNKINTELEQMAKILYNYWFVQFDFPNTEGKPYKSSSGDMVYDSVLKREIPKGWEVKKLEYLVEGINTGLNPRDHFKLGEGENFYITIRNIEYGIVSFNESCDRISDVSLKRIQQRSKLEKGDILFTSIEPVGKTYLLSEKPKNWNINESVFSIKPNHKLVTSEFLFMLLSSDEMKLKCKNSSTGSIHKGIRITPLKAFSFSYGGIEIINSFSEKITPILNKIDLNQKQNQELIQLRDWLLPMLINGQVTVGDAEEMVNEQLDMVAEGGVEYQLNLTDKDKKIRRKMLATYIINQSLNDISFGKTKFEKLLHLVECHIVKGDYNQKYSVQAAGPYDGGFTKVFWNEVIKAKWFKIEEFGRLKRIMPADNHSKSLVDYGYLSEDLKLMINDFIAEFKNTNYERPEIISTLYAVWNNRIICNEIITDELLKKDFLEWDTQKARYSDRLDNALIWMRENGIIPNGWGNEVKRAKK